MVIMFTFNLVNLYGTLNRICSINRKRKMSISNYIYNDLFTTNKIYIIYIIYLRVFYLLLVRRMSFQLKEYHFNHSYRFK